MKTYSSDERGKNVLLSMQHKTAIKGQLSEGPFLEINFIMESTRQKKVSRLIQKELGDYFQKKGREYNNKMITVTIVRISPDLSNARVYLSIFPVSRDDDTLDRIKHNGLHIRNELGKKIRKQLRIVPELAFYIDDSLDYIENIEELLKK